MQELEKSYEGLIIKELPKNLKYVFLGAERSEPITIAIDLTEDKEKKLIEILRKYKEAIIWSVEDLKGISPSKNPPGQKCKTSIEHQRKLIQL